MKKLFLIGMTVLLFGCATTGGVKNAGDLAPIGVITVSAYDDIAWYGDKRESAGLIGNVLNKAIDKKLGEKVGDLLPLAEKTLREKLEAKGISVIPAATILDSAAYKSAGEDKLFKSSGLIMPAGYRYLTMKNSGLIKDLSAGTGMKSALYVSFDFTKAVYAGVQKNGTAKAAVTMTVQLLDTKGKAILQKSYYGESAETFTIVSGFYKPESLMAQFPSAIDSVCDKFLAALGK